MFFTCKVRFVKRAWPARAQALLLGSEVVGVALAATPDEGLAGFGLRVVEVALLLISTESAIGR